MNKRENMYQQQRYFTNTREVLTNMMISLLLISGASYADELEIYTRPATSGSGTIEPAVLFILDSSGSMAEGLPSGEPKRLAMEKTLVELFTETDSAKAGLSRYNTNYGSAITYPISSLTALAKNIPGESSEITTIDQRVKIALTNESVPFVPNSRKDVIGPLEVDQNNPIGKKVALYFYNVDITRNDEITNATLDLYLAGDTYTNQPAATQDTIYPGKNRLEGDVDLIFYPLHDPIRPSGGTLLIPNNASGFIKLASNTTTIIKEKNETNYKVRIDITNEIKKVSNSTITSASGQNKNFPFRNYEDLSNPSAKPANGVMIVISLSAPAKGGGKNSKAQDAYNRTKGFYVFSNRASDTLGDDITSPTLRITGEKSVRHRLLEMVSPKSPHNSVEGEQGTPILESLIESYNYWEGGSVIYGKTRGKVDVDGEPLVAHEQAQARISHEGAIVPSTYNRSRPSSCSLLDYNNPNCANEKLTGTPKYNSPLQECNNSQVLLTDGAPTHNNDSARILAEKMVKTVDPYVNCKSAISGNNHPEARTHIPQSECIKEFVGLMKKTDFSTSQNGKQNIITSVISYGNSITEPESQQLLQETANAGGGSLYEAKDARELIDALRDVIKGKISIDPASHSAPIVVPDPLNPLATRPYIYLAQFLPSTKRSWDGNLKKYALCLDSTLPICSGKIGSVVDTNGQEVFIVDQDNNGNVNSYEVDASTKSFWSSSADGNVDTGSVGEKLYNATNRSLYVGSLDKKNVTRYHDPDQWNASNLSEARNAVCNTHGASSAECEKLMRSLLINSTSTKRWLHKDIVHSHPIAIFYGLDTASKPIYKLLYGSNDGILHLVNDEDGKEQWGFLPYQFLSNQKAVIKEESVSTGNTVGEKHIYGFDVTPTTLITDPNRNGVKKSEGDIAMAFLALGRGGRTIYALDLASATNGGNVTSQLDAPFPQLKWAIDHNTSGFDRLGFTYSQPTVAYMLVDNKKTPVLVFGGGYDTALDDDQTNGNVSYPNLGNALYIVNAVDGKLIYKLDQNKASAMKHSIPSSIAVVDRNGNGIDDRVYFGDTGGQVWRVDFGGLSLNTAADTAVYGILASLGDENASSHERRKFFYAPAIVPIQDKQFSKNAKYDYILLGSGNRARPRDGGTINDHFYALRDYQVSSFITSTSTTGTTRAKNYPIKNNSAVSNSPLGLGNLIDITNTSFVNNSGNANTIGKAAQNQDGWYYNYSGSTEKVLASPSVLPYKTGGKMKTVVYVSSYESTTSTSLCADVDPGKTYERQFDLLSTSGVFDWNTTTPVAAGTISNRKRQVGKGFVPTSSTLPQTGSTVARIRPGGIGADNVERKTLQRSYWHDQ